MPKLRIGCSGFLYDSWRGPFYPEALPQKKCLPFYVKKFNSVELNVTFYRLLKKEAFERWYRETPPQFSFCLKGSRFITHIKKLRDVDLPVITFFNTTSPLMEKLEVVLWQLPPNFVANIKNLGDFIEAVKVYLERYPVRHVFEFRHKSWLNKKVFKLLSDSNIAVCMADWPKFIDELPVTADFVYIRRHGEAGSCSTSYSTEQLKKDAKRIKNYLSLGKDVYIFFNNDASGYAAKNALELRAMLGKSFPRTARKTKKPVKPAYSPRGGAGRTGRHVKPKKTSKKKKVKPVHKKTVKKSKPKRPAVKKLKTRKILKKHTKKAVRKITKKKIIKKPLKKKPARKAQNRK